MVAYWLLWVLAVGGIFWVVYKLLMRLWNLAPLQTDSLKRKKKELKKLDGNISNLNTEIAVSKELVLSRDEYESLESELDEIDGKKREKE